MKRFILGFAFAVLAFVGSAAAQGYPTRPINMIVPYPPGGPTDTLARIFAERLRASLGQPVVVENVSGAAGSIGVARATRAAPDGYTFNFGNVASHVFSTIVFKTQYDVLTDLEPIALMTSSPMWLLSGTKLPAKNLKELVVWLKANPDKGTFAIVGAGSPAHLCGVTFQNRTGTKFQFVPYKGAGPAMQDVMGGQVHLTCLEASATRPHVAAGKLKPYALLSKTRWSGSPDVPTVDEAGVPGLYLPFWHGLWVPKATPAAVVARINAAVVETLADSAVQDRLTKLGVEILPRDQQSPSALRAFLKAEIDKWRPIIEGANIKPN
ncbi:MAG: Bug family tripartite tricarboxylate transporter substrate binding protein [Xanthobacteraceae bacterium]